MARGVIGVLAACATAASAASAAAPVIKPVPGLVVTTTVHSTVVTAASRYGVLDTENLFSIAEVRPDGLTYSIRMSAPANVAATEELKKFNLKRTVRRVDLDAAARMTLLYSSDDPPLYAGQTFAETSTAVLTALKTQGESPFVFGANFEDQTFASWGITAANGVPKQSGKDSGPPVNVSSLLSMLGSARHYYRGTLRRVEPGPVAFSVLLDGVRMTVPAVHAAGDFSFGTSPPVRAEVWWLDSPAWPLTLKWTLGKGSALVTRIDTPVQDPGVTGGAQETLAAQLAGKGCHAELHGIYFNTGSAQLLEESAPMLQTVAAFIKSNAAAQLSVDGHTDNIGSAQYNQELSEKRAAAVRQALMGYGVPGGRLSARGFGMTHPVESNDTAAGRARNRRVELARPCAAER